MDPHALREDIPALDDVVYLNTGASGPSPRRVVEAAEDALEHHAFDSPGAEGPYPYAFELFEETRETVADFLGTDASHVALTQSTADGVNRVASAIDWEPGDVVVNTDLEHPAGTLPWRRLADVHDLELRTVPTEDGRVDRDAYADAVADARLVCFSAITWTHGTHLPVEDLVAEAHDADAEVLVDAVQSPGQRPMPVESWGADFVAAAGHKWLLGPWGAGFLYVDPDTVESLEPVQIGYMGAEEAEDESYAFAEGAKRLEIGTTSPAPYAGLQEAITTVERVGLDTVQTRVERLTDRLKDGLGDRLVSPAAYESGLVTFTADDPEELVERLKEEHDVVVRDLPTGNVRASLHVFNTTEDVDTLLNALDEC